MNEIKMNEKELVYIASLLGAKEFFGLRDPFFGMDQSEIAAAISEMQVALDLNGLLEADFLGGVQVSQKARALIEPCAFCDAYALGEYQEQGVAKRFTVYFRGETTVLLTTEANSAVLSFCTAADICRMLAQALEGTCPPSADVSNNEQCRFSYVIVEQARMMALRGDVGSARDKMLTSGLSPSIADAFLSSFIDGSTRSAFVVTNFKENKVDSILCISKLDKLICITRDRSRDDGNDWVTTEMTNEQYLRCLENLLERTRWSVC